MIDGQVQGYSRPLPHGDTFDDPDDIIDSFPEREIVARLLVFMGTYYRLDARPNDAMFKLLQFPGSTDRV